MPVPINRNRSRPLGVFQQRVWSALDGAEWRSVADLLPAFPINHSQKIRSALEGMFRRGRIAEDYTMAAPRYRRKAG